MLETFVRQFRNIVFFVICAAGFPAWAQRAEENAVNAAQDAFGTTVGQETVGLYSSGSARGFNPRQAGNLRIEGLFFHGPTTGPGVSLSNRLFKQSTMHVGLSAQSYPFPSPTGIADYSLRIPGDTFVASAALRLGPQDSMALEVDTQIPVLAPNVSLGVGVSGERTITDHGASFYRVSAAVIGRWRIGDDIEILPFWSQERNEDNELAPWIFTGGPYFPKKYKRSTSAVPEWAEINNRDTTFGTAVRASWNDWRLRLGAFRSLSARTKSILTLYFNTQPDGSGDRQFWFFPNAAFPASSNSGEVRLSRLFNEGPRRHSLSVNARGRASIQGSGGVDRVDAGLSVIGQPPPFAEPRFNILPRTRERVHQGSLGLSYEGQWLETGEFSAGLQRVFYRRTTDLPVTKTTSSAWLYNATLAAYLTGDLVLYSSYTRGLEDSPNAPSTSANEGRGVAASITKQIDAGFRYSFGPSVKFVAGVFEVRKPFFAVDSANFYRQLGRFTHRGVELSLAGEPVQGLRIVTGAVLLKARTSGPLVGQGVVGRVSTGSFPFTANLNVQYGPASWRGFSVDMKLAYESDYFADTANTYKVPAQTPLDLGARYRTTLSNVPTTFRLQVTNVMNDWHWRVVGSERLYRPSSPRKVTLQVTADF